MLKKHALAKAQGPPTAFSPLWHAHVLIWMRLFEFSLLLLVVHGIGQSQLALKEF
jgi:hypothetical protein